MTTAQFILKAPDDAMAPLIPAGADIVCERVEEGDIDPGTLVIFNSRHVPGDWMIRRYDVRTIAGKRRVVLSAEKPGTPEIEFTKGRGYWIMARCTSVSVALGAA